MAETTSVWKRPSTAGAQLSKAPTLEAGGEETQLRGRPILLETGTAKNELSRKLTWPSLRFQRPLVKVRGPRSYSWRDLYNLSFLVSLNLPRTGGWQGHNGGTLERLLLSMSQRRYLLSPSICYPSWWGFFCPFSSLCQGSDQ